MGLEECKRIHDGFAKDLSACGHAQAGARILISKDAGGEGLHLQFCHVVINYDIPWNPMRLEQRIGRVDRIGQTHTVRAINFVFEDSVEHRVCEVLEEKLAVIFEEFRIDKIGDVLDSAQAEKIFTDLFVEAILTNRQDSRFGRAGGTPEGREPGTASVNACRKIVRLAEGIENETPVHTALLLYKARALRGLGLLDAARETLTGALRRKKDRSEELLRALRYERALVYEDLGQRRRARSELEKLYAEDPDYEDVAARLGL
nr:helicase-related protein [Parvivirga hydrogeniphila]